MPIRRCVIHVCFAMIAQLATTCQTSNVGAGLVVYGGSAVEDAGRGLGWNDAVGIGIGFISMLGEPCTQGAFDRAAAAACGILPRPGMEAQVQGKLSLEMVSVACAVGGPVDQCLFSALDGV